MHNDVSAAVIVIGDTKLTFEIPTSLFKLISIHGESKEISLYSHNTITIIEILRGLIPKEMRPATQHQESYVRTISKALNLVVSDDIFNSVENCSKFIDLHSEKYKLIKNQEAELRRIKNEERSIHKRFISQANRVNKWLLVKDMLDSKVELDKVAVEFSVKPATIEKYLNQLDNWLNDSLIDNTRKPVMDLVYRLHNGEDLYMSYYQTYYSK